VDISRFSCIAVGHPQQNRGELQKTMGKLPLTAADVSLKLYLIFMRPFIPIACASQRFSASVRGLKHKQTPEAEEK